MLVELNLCNINFHGFIPCAFLDSDWDVGEDSRLLGFCRLLNSRRCFCGACCSIVVVGNYSSIDTSPYWRRLESSVAAYILHISSLKVIILSTREADKSVVKWNTNWETTWRKGSFRCRCYVVRLTFFPSIWQKAFSITMPIVCVCKMQNFWIFGQVLGHIYLPPCLKGKPIKATRWTMLARGVLSFLVTWTVVWAT